MAHPQRLPRKAPMPRRKFTPPPRKVSPPPIPPAVRRKQIRRGY